MRSIARIQGLSSVLRVKSSLRNTVNSSILRPCNISLISTYQHASPPQLRSIRSFGTQVLFNNEETGSDLSTTATKTVDKKYDTQFKVKTSEDQMRLDRMLKVRVPGLPLSLMQKLIRTRRIEVDSKRASSNDRVSTGQVVTLPRDIFEQYKDAPKIEKELDPVITEQVRSLVIYKDDHILAINKPPGLACQGGSKISEHVDKYLDYLKYDYEEKPRLVHRLDKDASGVLLLGRTRQATSKLQYLFKDHDRIQKTYWALVTPEPAIEIGTITVALEKVMVGGEEKVIVKDKVGGDAKLGITHYRTMLRVPQAGALLAMFPETGRTHQLRVSCAEALKTPILGDFKYGSKERGILSVFPEECNNLFLHARRIEFEHPISKNKRTSIVAPLPQHFQTFFKAYGYDTPKNDNYPNLKEVRRQNYAPAPTKKRR